MEDRFTRQVLPLHRNSTRRQAQAFPIVTEEKDSSPEPIGSLFLHSSASIDSELEMALPQRPQRMPVGERYKRYARSNRSSVNDGESCASWSSTEEEGFAQ